jgi:hypothetical protein
MRKCLLNGNNFGAALNYTDTAQVVNEYSITGIMR